MLSKIHHCMIDGSSGADVAQILMSPSPEHEVLHNDGDPWNNSVSNLRYGTTRENAQDRERHRRQRLGLVDELDEDGLPPYVPDAVLGF